MFKEQKMEKHVCGREDGKSMCIEVGADVAWREMRDKRICCSLVSG